MRPLVVVDTETTGFPAQAWARVVEVGAVLIDLDTGEELSTFASLVCPDVLDERATGALGVNGLTVDEIRAAPTTAEVAAGMAGWLEAAGRQVYDVPGWLPWITAYNVAFDRPMLDRMFAGAGTWARMRWASCVMQRAQEGMGARRWVNLRTAALYFEVPQQEPAHRALADARTAALVALAIHRREGVRVAVEGVAR